MSVARDFMKRFAFVPTTRWLRTCDRVGDGAVLDAAPTILNSGAMLIGARFHLASRPVQSHLATGPDGRLEIHDDVAIGHGAAIAAYELVRIGDGTRIGPFVVVMDTDFHAAGDRSTRYDTTPITIGRRARIGSRVTILRGTTIGDDAEIVAGSVVSGAVAAGARATGVPARVIRSAIASSGEGGEGGNRSVAARVPEVMRLTFGLTTSPALEDARAQIPQWDSLGALKLLLALEDAFAVALDEDEIARARSVGDLARVVERRIAAGT